jgi:hypothetical protein
MPEKSTGLIMLRESWIKGRTREITICVKPSSSFCQDQREERMKGFFMSLAVTWEKR